MSERGKLKVWVVVGLSCLGVALVGWGIGLCGAEEPPVGRYQAVAPNLVLDTMTGKLSDSKGTLLESPFDASGKQVGRYSAAGYQTAITRLVGLNVMNQPYAQQELIKGYSIVDTKTGQVLKDRIYSSQPIAVNELQPT